MSQLNVSLQNAEEKARLQNDFPCLAVRIFHLFDVIDGWFAQEKGEKVPHVISIKFGGEAAKRFEARMQHYFEHGALWREDRLPRPNFEILLCIDFFGTAEEVSVCLSDCSRKEGLLALREDIMRRAQVHYRRRFRHGAQ